MGQQNMGQGYMQQGNMQQGNMQQGNMGQQTISSGTCGDPMMDINNYIPGGYDSIGFGKASWQYSPMDWGGCNSLNTLKLSLFPKGDQKSPQQFRLQVREMCCDKKCAENSLPNVDCLYGPPGKVLNWNTYWIDPCFNLPRNQTAVTQTQTPVTQPQTSPAQIPTGSV
ncbi:uncharacterized protein MELLADRAFT_60310 [Melampsora larici-populina 98AG31]|uniref:Uncharacterized protein n=1 Tax=Melampsora larici-populina (strain 98AG31 / pathotype 3-4-7) TaxID=747676 RepID=F4RAV5_MELLP|nr:uncharacterized protein MELLADRAFT_60310 [Melampsora larici-populina 98AG31]EGG10712.1 hypothetical protein MELLADRAFT_60310 [Melampsora larici-populina 98AG31]